jgi:inorganic pyrophosphatase
MRERLPLSRGTVTESAGPDHSPLDALVLLDSPALPGVSVHAQPVGLLHLSLGGVPHDEVVCISDGRSPDELGDLAHPTANEPLRETVRRAHSSYQ